MLVSDPYSQNYGTIKVCYNEHVDGIRVNKKNYEIRSTFTRNGRPTVPRYTRLTNTSYNKE
jgi:hypothetical protein